jgi:hypothetical protein
MDDRRSFLKRLGLGAAIIPNTVGDAGADRSAAAETVRAPECEIPESGFLTELTSDWLYSGLVIPRNSMRDSYYLFADALGHAAPAGGQVDLSLTNMLRPCQLPPPHVFAFNRVGVFVSPGVACRLWAAFAERATLEIQVGQKVYFRAPLAALFDVRELSQDDGLYTVSADLLRGAMRLDLPVVIPAGMQFSGSLYVREPFAVHGKIKLWAYLAGRSSRGLQ